jgi:hypothetical protein
VYELLDLWEPPVPQQALQLLDRRFMDPKVRAFAVHCLEELEDEELALYMLQLCQQLKFENHADSALSRFLLRRSLANKRLIGHIFFWQLQSEVQNVDVRQRFVILLQVDIFSLHVVLCLYSHKLNCHQSSDLHSSLRSPSHRAGPSNVRDETS